MGLPQSPARYSSNINYLNLLVFGGGGEARVDGGGGRAQVVHGRHHRARAQQLRPVTHTHIYYTLEIAAIQYRVTTGPTVLTTFGN